MAKRLDPQAQSVRKELTLTPEDFAKLQRIAEADMRSANAMIRKLIREAPEPQK